VKRDKTMSFFERKFVSLHEWSFPGLNWDGSETTEKERETVRMLIVHIGNWEFALATKVK